MAVITGTAPAARGDHLLLDRRNLRHVDLDPQIARRHHHGVRRGDDASRFSTACGFSILATIWSRSARAGRTRRGAAARPTIAHEREADVVDRVVCRPVKIGRSFKSDKARSGQPGKLMP